jgi:serine kinase
MASDSLKSLWNFFFNLVLIFKVCGSIPFDDSNLKKMIKFQLEGKLRFPAKMQDKVDPLAKDLIGKMLEPDVMRRANIDKVIKHSWVQAIEN